MTRAGQKYWARRKDLGDKFRHPKDAMARTVPLSYYDSSRKFWHWDFIYDKNRFVAFNSCKEFRG